MTAACPFVGDDVLYLGLYLLDTYVLLGDPALSMLGHCPLAVAFFDLPVYTVIRLGPIAAVLFIG